MWQTLLVTIIVAGCGFLLGRRYYRQWRRALTSGPGDCPETSCCSCPSAGSCADFEAPSKTTERRD